LKNYEKNTKRNEKRARSHFFVPHAAFWFFNFLLSQFRSKLKTHNSKICYLSLLLCALTGCQDQQTVKRDQYLAEGFGLYQTHCANCHGKDGKGLAGLYPKIDAKYLKDRRNMAVWIKFGQQNPVVIDGKTYVRPMPGNAALQELEIAEIITYVTNTWGQETTLYPTDSVALALEKYRLAQK